MKKSVFNSVKAIMSVKQDTTVDTRIDASALVELKENTEKHADWKLNHKNLHHQQKLMMMMIVMKLIQLRLMNLNQMTQMPPVKLIWPRNWCMLRSTLCLREHFT